MSAENTKFFNENEHRPAVGYADHNVGPGVLQASKIDVIQKVDKHYGLRGGHIPDADAIGVVVAEASPQVKAQMDYLSQLFGRKIEVAQIDEFIAGNEDTLVVSYINTTSAAQRLESKGIRVWGLPSQLVDEVKNKARFHIAVAECQVPDFTTPEFVVCDTDELVDQGFEVLYSTAQQYDSAGMLGRYPVGVIVRAAECDGGYGSAVIKEEGDTIIVLLDGSPNDTQRFNKTPDGWEAALEVAQVHLKGAMNQQIESRVVINRLMQLEDSPGLSLIVIKGEVFSLGWNGQVVENGGTACVGTSKYQPKSAYAAWAQQEWQVRSAESFGNFLRAMCTRKGVDFNKVVGIANTDVMIPGPLEREFRGKNNPDQISFAEINPRFTNFTDAVLAAGWINGKPQTVSAMRETINQGIIAIDKYTGTEKIDVVRFRDSIYELDQRLKNSGTRVVVRMPDTPTGMILTGDISHAKHEVDNILAKLA